MVFEGRALIRRERVAVGTGGTPTPTGRFYITMVVKWSDPSGPYGPYALGLSAWSEVLDSFAGGDGQIAIHGTSDPSSIGQPASNGCVRLSNPSISRLARILPAGTPVTIRP
jgi:lipoprotein-anchoring transpeptidase ErfK/SrfK